MEHSFEGPLPFKLFLRPRNIQKAEWQLGSKCPSSYSTLKTSTTSRIMTPIGGGGGWQQTLWYPMTFKQIFLDRWSWIHQVLVWKGRAWLLDWTRKPADSLWSGHDLPMQPFERDLSFLKFIADKIEVYEAVGESYNFIVTSIYSQERVDLGLERLELFFFWEGWELGVKMGLGQEAVDNGGARKLLDFEVEVTGRNHYGFEANVLCRQTCKFSCASSNWRSISILSFSAASWISRGLCSGPFSSSGAVPGLSLVVGRGICLDLVGRGSVGGRPWGLWGSQR